MERGNDDPAGEVEVVVRSTRSPIRFGGGGARTEALRELVTCPICLERLRLPKMLPCQHTFCFECLQNVAVSGRTVEETLRCPQCRSEHGTPKEGLAALPTNISLQSLLDVIDAKDTSCCRCQTVCEVTMCEHCNLGMCGVCLECHVDELKVTMAEIGNQLEVTHRKINNRLQHFKNACDILRAQIREESERRLQEVTSKEEELLRHLQEAVVSEEKVAKTATTRLDDASRTLKETFETDFDCSGHPANKIEVFLSLHRESSELLSDLSDLDRNLLCFDPEGFRIQQKRRSCNSPQAHVESSPSPDEESPSDDPLNESSRGSEDQSRFYRSKSFSGRGRLGAGLLQRPSGLAVSTFSQEVFVVAMDSHKIFVFDLSSGKLMKSFGQRGQRAGEFLCPFGIALCTVEQKILITDKWKHCVHVFGRDGKFRKQLGSKGRSQGHFRSPEAICVDQNGRIYVCDTCNNRIQVLDKDGTFISEIGTCSQVEAGCLRQRSMFSEPTGVAVSPDGQRVVVSDFGQHRVHVFTSTGQHLLTFGQKGHLRGQFIHPECVAVDQMGFIFVGDSGNGRVQICRPDGRFVRAFGSKGSNGGQFSWISGVAVTDKFDVVVSDFKNHCVQIF